MVATASIPPSNSFASASVRRFLLAAALPVGICTGGPEATQAAGLPVPSPEKLERITEFFNNEVATGKLPGAVVLIQQHGRPVYLKCFRRP